jgi:hypothetical protein
MNATRISVRFILLSTIFNLHFIVVDSFLPPIPQMMIRPLLTDLEGIATTQVIRNTFLTNIRTEITINNLFSQITEFHYVPSDFIFVSVLLTLLYSQSKYIQGYEDRTTILKISKYEKCERLIKEIAFVLLLVFTRDVHNAI